MLEVKCPICGKVMEWCDTTDVEGSLAEGWLTEVMTYHCSHCDKSAEVEASAPIKSNDTIISVVGMWDEED